MHWGTGDRPRPGLGFQPGLRNFGKISDFYFQWTLARHGRAVAEQHWIVKVEPDSYAWAQFLADGFTAWTGVRNYLARNHLRTMKAGDPVLYYHSMTEKAVVGLARVKRTAYADPTATAGDWAAVDLEPVKPLARPVSLAELRADPVTAGMALVRNSRISVTPVSPAEYLRILVLGKSPI